MERTPTGKKSFSEAEIVEAQTKAMGLIGKKIKGEVTTIGGLSPEEDAFLEKTAKVYRAAAASSPNQPITISPSAEDAPVFQSLIEKLTSAYAHGTTTTKEKNTDRFFDGKYLLSLIDIIHTKLKPRQNPAHKEAIEKIGGKWGQIMNIGHTMENNTWGLPHPNGKGTSPTKEEFIADVEAVEEILKHAGVL